MKPLAPSLALLLSTAVAAQTTIHVPADVPTIQGAIALAQDGDTVLVASGTYNELIDYLGKAITVASASGAAATTIDGTGLFDSVVRFASREGRGSILRGFTITGGYGGSEPGGIYAYEATPRIEACVIRGNRTGAAPSPGVMGNARLVDCVIEGNSGFASAGGVWGEAVLRRCLVRGNTGYDAGGLYLFGRGRAVDCVIVQNSSIEGTYGGGVYLAGPDVELVRCLIADNTAASLGQYPVSSAGVFVYSPSGSALIRSCTIVGNHVISPHVPPGEDCGGVQGQAELVNTIVRDNDGLQIGNRATVQATYSNIQGGHPGPGNFDQPPLFVDAPNGDYHLAAGSPCIDAGVPLAALDDPDGTRGDVGAFYYPQANAIVRNGTGVNPLFLSSLTPPRLGTSWQARIDSALVPSAAQSVILVERYAREPGLLLPEGELLIDGPLILSAVLPSSGGPDDFSFPVPNQTALLGFEAHAQGVIVTTTGRVRLGNALRLVLGY